MCDEAYDVCTHDSVCVRRVHDPLVSGYTFAWSVRGCEDVMPLPEVTGPCYTWESSWLPYAIDSPVTMKYFWYVGDGHALSR